MSGAPLRLAFTGRLEKMKGADDLIEIAAALDRAGKDFSLDVFGSGSLTSEMEAALNDPAAGTLRRKVRINAPVDFNRELVPWMRSEVDLFVCCHRQSDPSCTYLETLGCGVPIVGYSNRALAGILKLTDIGWMTPVNSKEEMARKIIDLDSNRFQLASRMRTARNFAKEHSFESEFKSRVDHLWKMSEDTKRYNPLSIGPESFLGGSRNPAVQADASSA
jgi:glycosyltransferase involved in cell wall biosynthesis